MMVTGDSDAAAENIAYATGLAVRPGTRPTAPAAPPAGSEADVERGEAAAAGARPLVRVPASSPTELLDAITMLLPAARLGEYCYLFGAATTATLRRLTEALEEEERRLRAGGVAQQCCRAAAAAMAAVLPPAAASALRRRVPGCAPPPPASAEATLARAVVDAMVQLLHSGAHTLVWAQVSVDQIQN